MPIKFHDTASRKLVRFTPRVPGHAGIYVCGPTVYDHIHIGNARPLVVFDVFVRLLRSRYEKVTYVRNITDVDDKINARANALEISISTLTEKTIKDFKIAARELGCIPPDYEPRATQYIPQMLELIRKLVELGHAYKAAGHVLFDTKSFAQYGEFSGKSLDELLIGARVETAPYKRSETDFVLWKPSNLEQPGWDCEYGRGRPGWHIECSAMSKALLGNDFDIHGGGLDLIFPHHQNEVAQSCCLHPENEYDQHFAKYWMHNGYVMSEGEKMSKSLGNFYTINDLLSEFPGEVLRLSLLKTHYRKPLDFTKARLVETKAELDGFYRLVQDEDMEAPLKTTAKQKIKTDQVPDAQFIKALEDDLNTPLALTRLHALADKIKAAKSDNVRKKAIEKFKVTANFIGLLETNSSEWLQGKKVNSKTNIAHIERMIELRKEAKNNRDYKAADEIRNGLLEKKIILEDKPDGRTIWRKI